MGRVPPPKKKWKQSFLHNLLHLLPNEEETLTWGPGSSKSIKGCGNLLGVYADLMCIFL